MSRGSESVSRQFWSEAGQWSVSEQGHSPRPSLSLFFFSLSLFLLSLLLFYVASFCSLHFASCRLGTVVSVPFSRARPFRNRCIPVSRSFPEYSRDTHTRQYTVPQCGVVTSGERAKISLQTDVPRTTTVCQRPCIIDSDLRIVLASKCIGFYIQWSSDYRTIIAYLDRDALALIDVQWKQMCVQAEFRNLAPLYY